MNISKLIEIQKRFIIVLVAFKKKTHLLDCIIFFFTRTLIYTINKVSINISVNNKNVFIDSH